MATETLLNSFPKKNNAMTTTPLRITVLGIGMMGLPMARRLSEAGHQVHAWNRTRAKAEPLTQWGVTVHSSPADAVKDADVAISLLENGPVVGQVLFEQGTAQAMRPGALFIDMASIQPSEAPTPPCAATVCERVGKTLDSTATLRPARASCSEARMPEPPAPTITTSNLRTLILSLV